MKLTVTNGLGTSTHKSASTEKKNYGKNRKNTERPGKLMPITVDVIQRNSKECAGRRKWKQNTIHVCTYQQGGEVLWKILINAFLRSY